MNETAGILFALVTTLSWSIGIFPFTQAARRLGSHSLNHFRLLLAAVLLLITSFIVDASGFIHLFDKNYSQAWFWLGLSGIVGLTVGDYFAFVMYAILGARIGSVLTTLAPAAALLLGTLLVNESISVIGIAGILITIFGVINISLGRSERKAIPDHGHGTSVWGIVAGILGALCQGAGLAMARKGFMNEQAEGFHVHPVHATFIRLSIATASLFLFSMVQGRVREVWKPVKENPDHGIRYAVLGTLFGPFIGVCFSLYAVSLIDASVAQTIFSLVPVFALIISRIFYKDKISFKSFIGMVIAIVGVMILIWRKELAAIF